MATRRRNDDEWRVLQRYMEEISLHNPLSNERERELGRIIQDPATLPADRDLAIEELVRANLRFVVSYAKRFHSSDVSFLDIINEGNIGLLQAARRFDPGKEVRFISYAVWWVRQAISHAMNEQAGALRLPHKQAALHARVGRAREELSQAMGREPSIDEIAKAADVSAEDAEMLLSMSRTAESLSQTIGEEQQRTLDEILEQTTVAAADDELLKRSSIEQTRGLLQSLPKKEREVLCRRYGIPPDGSDDEREPMTLQEIGDELKVSRERVRQIEAQALARIRKTLKERTLRAYLN